MVFFSQDLAQNWPKSQNTVLQSTSSCSLSSVTMRKNTASLGRVDFILYLGFLGAVSDVLAIVGGVQYYQSERGPERRILI